MLETRSSRTYADPRTNLQQTFDAAVVTPTIMRPDIEQALRSVFDQDVSGRVQVLVGIDRLVTDLTPIHEASPIQLCRAGSIPRLFDISAAWRTEPRRMTVAFCPAFLAISPTAPS